ncbi:MAG: FHA domain-containing protein [Gammaproteobacteria bacterium]|nr:FHA domain-containing protein [Gammaproteobacteria bacterium]
MSKIVIKHHDAVVGNFDLKDGDAKIGRRAGCDIHLDHLAVSSEHARISTVDGESFLQDLSSTNGTFIDNKRVSRHHLAHGDVVIIGEYALVYLDAQSKKGEGATNKTSSDMPDPAVPDADNLTVRVKHGQLFVLEGTNSGKRIDLAKAVTNLGKTGKHSGTVTRTVDGYVLQASGESDKPKLNGQAVPAAGVKLRNGDVIEITGARLQFYLK